MDSDKQQKDLSSQDHQKLHNNKRFGLFDVTGIEMEYMIVDKTTLSVKPLCDMLMKAASGQIVGDYDNGAIMWSNEIVNHLVELKTNGPVRRVTSVVKAFHDNVQQVNRLLQPFNAVLMPTGAHPWMDPYTETRLWEHESNEVYNLYNQIFDCRGHGWSNLQSTHLNLPFANDEEFGKLHAAIRVLLPIIPALSASTPILDGRITGVADTRLETYRNNQKKIPSITGKIIPEQAFSEEAYYAKIFNPMMRDVAPYDPDHILECHFLNSRGAIARFDRGAIEIRVLDIQECSMADLAIAEGIVAVLKSLVHNVSLHHLQRWHEDDLVPIFNQCVQHGELAVIDNRSYLQLFDVDAASMIAGELWRTLQTNTAGIMEEELGNVFKQIVSNGTLSSRIIRYLNGDNSLAKMKETYRELVLCLSNNTLFNCTL